MTPFVQDNRVRQPRLPLRIVWQDGEVCEAELLTGNNRGQALATAVPGCRLRGKGASVVLDFGQEIHGSLQLVSGPLAAMKPVPVRLRFGESVSETFGEPSNDHALHDLQILVPSMGAQEYGMTGFRFARLELLQDDVLDLSAVRAITLMRPEAKMGRFHCSDPRLNQVWETGAHTVHLCMQDLLWDGVKRDRLVWLGDMHPEVSVISAVWGKHAIVPQSLDWVRDHTPLPQWMNGIGSYSLWWLLIQHHWYLHHGDRAYLESQRAYLCGLLLAILEQVEEDGTVNWRGWQFLDWPTEGKPEAVYAGLVGLLVWALDAAAQLCHVLGEAPTAQRAQMAALTIRARAPRLPVESKQACALLALAGLHPLEQVNREILAHKPLQGLSTFYGFYVLQARAEAGDICGALQVIRVYWGAMLDLGATSFWEDFDLSWAPGASRIDELPVEGKSDLHRERGAHCYVGHRHSLCHGWAAGPTAWLSRWVLGVEPLEPGCRVVRVAPRLGDLEWVEGSFPTPQGLLQVRHEREEQGAVTTTIRAPEGVQVVR